MAKLKNKGYLFERTNRKHRMWWLPRGFYCDPRYLPKPPKFTGGDFPQADQLDEGVKDEDEDYRQYAN